MDCGRILIVFGDVWFSGVILIDNFLIFKLGMLLNFSGMVGFVLGVLIILDS